MRRKFCQVMAAAMVISVLYATAAFAADWKQDKVGWWYVEDNGTYPTNCWKWINEKCYYFGADGYMLANTVTPDGYTVDASGAWLPNVAKIEGPATTKSQTQTPGKEYIGEIPGHIYIPGYGYVEVSENGAAQPGDPAGNTSWDDLSGHKIGTMN